MNYPIHSNSGLACVGVVISIAAMTFSFAAASGQDDLNALVADYQAYGLPQPSDHSELAVLKWSNSTVNGVPQYSRVIVLLEPATEDTSSRY